MGDWPNEDLLGSWVRARLADGVPLAEVLAVLRSRGLDKVKSVSLVQTATGVSLGEAKALVHVSPVWEDRRQADEHVEDLFWRAAFIWCLLDGGQVDAPEEWAEECRERQQRARAQLQQATTDLPDHALELYHQFMTRDRLGEAFAALVAAGQQHHMPERAWRTLADAAETLCLSELLDDGTPAADSDCVRAAQTVRRRTRRSREDPWPDGDET